MESKRFLLDFIFSTLKLQGATMKLPLKQPFLVVQEMYKTQNWCPLSVVFRMECYKSIVSLSKEIVIARDMLGVVFFGKGYF